MAFDHAAIEQRAVLECPGLAGVVDLYQAKALRVAERPFKVIEQGPCEVALQVDPCGESRLRAREAHVPRAVRPCPLRTWATPQRLNGCPRAFTKTSTVGTEPRTANHAPSAVAVVVHSGKARSRRPLPRTWMVTARGATSWSRRPVSSETRSPALLHHRRFALQPRWTRSRSPSRTRAVPAG